MFRKRFLIKSIDSLLSWLVTTLRRSKSIRQRNTGLPVNKSAQRYTRKSLEIPLPSQSRVRCKLHKPGETLSYEIHLWRTRERNRVCLGGGGGREAVRQSGFSLLMPGTTTKAGNTRARWGDVLQRRLTGEHHPLGNSLIPFAPRARVLSHYLLPRTTGFLPPCVSPPQTLARNTRRRTHTPCYWWIPPLWNISTSRHEFIAHQLDPLYLVLFMINPHWYQSPRRSTGLP